MSQKQNGLSEKAEAAFQALTSTVIERAKATKTPVVVWEDGRIKEVASDQLEGSNNQDPIEKPSS